MKTNQTIPLIITIVVVISVFTILALHYTTSEKSDHPDVVTPACPICGYETDGSGLQRIINYCENEGPGVGVLDNALRWNNNTHHANNNTCELKTNGVTLDLSEHKQNDPAFHESQKLHTMSCMELFYDAQNRTHDYLGDNRELARDMLDECADEEEDFILHATCEEITERYTYGSMLYEDHQDRLAIKAIKCQFGDDYEFNP